MKNKDKKVIKKNVKKVKKNEKSNENWKYKKIKKRKDKEVRKKVCKLNLFWFSPVYACDRDTTL